MISRIVPMAISFLKYVRRSEALWTLSYSPTAEAKESAWAGKMATLRLGILKIWSSRRECTQNAPFLFAIGETGKARW